MPSGPLSPRLYGCLALAPLLVLGACRSVPPPGSMSPAEVASLLATGAPSQAADDAPVPAPLASLPGLRTCCAFGMDLRAELLGVTVPFLKVRNLLSPGELGVHDYGGGRLGTVGALLGLRRERDGLVLTRRAGFLDTAHVRDTADNTYYLFSRIWPLLGTEAAVPLGHEIGDRVVVLSAFALPERRADRVELAALVSAVLAYRLAEWHEIVQWYGYRSVAAYPEEVSAFSPEDLYSNLLGARLAMSAIVDGLAATEEGFDAALTARHGAALALLDARDRAEAGAGMAAVDGDLWDSKRRLPDRWLVRARDYAIGTARLPAAVPPGPDGPPLLPLSLDAARCGVAVEAVAELRVLPSPEAAAKLEPAVPLPPRGYWTPEEFPLFAAHARQADEETLPPLAAPR